MPNPFIKRFFITSFIKIGTNDHSPSVPLFFTFLLFYLLKQLVAFNILEVLIGADLQLVGCILVADDDAVLVHLKG